MKSITKIKLIVYILLAYSGVQLVASELDICVYYQGRTYRFVQTCFHNLQLCHVNTIVYIRHFRLLFRILSKTFHH